MDNLNGTGKGYTNRAKFYRVEFCESRDIDYYLSFIDKDQTKVLEIPCGAGRLTLDLAKRAKHVTAVDLEPLMLESLQEYISTAGLSEKVDILLGDMTNIKFGPIFDLIIVPSEALQLVPNSEGTLVINCLMENLKPGGLLIFDIATFSNDYIGNPDYFDPVTLGNYWTHQWNRNIPEIGTLSRSVKAEKNCERIKFEFLYKFLDDETNVINEFTEEMILYFYDAKWFIENVPTNTAQLSFRAFYDECNDLKNPPRLIVSLRKTIH